MPLDTVIVDGSIRKLGYLPPDANSQAMRATAGQLVPIPQSQWTEVDYVTGYPTSLINDQGSIGACVGFSCCGGNARQRYIRSGESIMASGWYVYDQKTTSPGQDSGMVIAEALTVITVKGAPLAAAYPKCLWKANQPTTGPIYKDVIIRLDSSAECATALMMGMLPQVPLNAGIFNSFNSAGVATGNIGTSANHSIYLAGMKKINGSWVFIMVNSWGVSWGPFKAGYCYIPLAAIDNPAQANDGWAHGNVIDPTEPEAPAPVLT